MRADFEDARNNVPHRGQAGGEGEAIVRQFLNDHLPGRYRATAGFIIDKADAMSGHVDVIVYDALNCPVYRTSTEGMIIPNDNVAAVIEVKFQLTTTTLDDALDKIHEVKNLTKTPLTEPHPLSQIIGTEGIIFAFESHVERRTIIDRWHAKLTERNPLHNTATMVVVSDSGIVTTVASHPVHGTSPGDFQGFPVYAAGFQFGLGSLATGESTLDDMMRLLLGHLTFFRPRIDHPGFRFAELGGQPLKIIGRGIDPRTVEYETSSGVRWLSHPN